MGPGPAVWIVSVRTHPPALRSGEHSFLPHRKASVSGVCTNSCPFGTCSFSSIQIVLENSSREDKHECPFGRSSIELTKMLCDILKVGELRKYTCPPGGMKLGRETGF